MSTCLLNESRTIRIDVETPDGPRQIRLQPTLWQLLSRAKPTDESWATFLIKNSLRMFLISPTMTLDLETVHWRSGRLAGYLDDKATGRNGNGTTRASVEHCRYCGRSDSRQVDASPSDVRTNGRAR